MKGTGIFGVLLLAGVLGSDAALAHTGQAAASAGAGFWSGLAHPIGGLDHVLAMVAVGLLAATLGDRRALWRVPGAFLAMMAAGGLAGMAGWSLPYVELGVVGSVVVLGALVAAGARRLPVLAAALVAGTFAIFHGHAHGAEAPVAAAVPLLYALGFVLATAALHAVGVGLGLLAGRGRTAHLALARVGGGAIAAAGALLLLV